MSKHNFPCDYQSKKTKKIKLSSTSVNFCLPERLLLTVHSINEIIFLTFIALVINKIGSENQFIESLIKYLFRHAHFKRGFYDIVHHNSVKNYKFKTPFFQYLSFSIIFPFRSQYVEHLTPYPVYQIIYMITVNTFLFFFQGEMDKR